MHSRFTHLFEDFRACHTDSLNTVLHLLTTPLGLWGAMSVLTAFNPWLAPALAGVYCLALVGRVPLGVWVSTLVLLTGLVGLAWWAHVGWAIGLALLVAGYLGQEFAHWLTGEPTFESTYIRQQGAAVAFAEHTFYLPPLVLAAAWESYESPLWWAVAQDRILHESLDDERSQRAIAAIRKWVLDRNPSREHTSHWWWHELDAGGKAAWKTLADAPQIVEGLRGMYGPSYVVDVVWDMNEVYVAGPDQQLTSDSVFYAPHLDGPLAVWPFCSVFRCLIAITPNERIRTHFPMVDPGYESGGRTLVLDEGQVLGFDFNREPHLISADPAMPASDAQRVVLKVHYATYPKVLAPLGRALAWATARYNRTARQVFLDTLTPSTPREKLCAAAVVGTNKVFEVLGRWVGSSNLAWVLLCAGVSLATHSWLPLIVGGSFMHYLIYIGTYQQGRKVSFNAWIRDAVFFKAVSFGILAALYVRVLDTVDPLSIVLSVVLMVVGFGISALATKQLGIERTYFGVELGLVEPRMVSAFPYGVVPHPMITGSVLGLIGVHLVIGDAHPWLVPANIAFYALHLAQEISGTHRRFGPKEAQV